MADSKLTALPSLPSAATSGDKAYVVRGGSSYQAPVAGAGGLATLDAGGKIPLAQLPAAVAGALSYQGTWNAATNLASDGAVLASGGGTPTPLKGYYYKTSVAGSTTLDGITSWIVGDLVVFNGTTWDKIDGNATEVVSVAGRTGVVVLAAADVSDSTATGRGVLTAATPAAARATLLVDQRTAVVDTNYTVVATDHLVSYTSITANRTVTLPSGSVFQAGQEVIINDESGSASATVQIIITASGGELIDGAATETIKAPGGMRRLFRTPTGWTFDKGVLRAGNNLSDVSNVTTARTNLDVPSNADAMLYSFIYGG